VKSLTIQCFLIRNEIVPIIRDVCKLHNLVPVQKAELLTRVLSTSELSNMESDSDKISRIYLLDKEAMGNLNADISIEHFCTITVDLPVQSHDLLTMTWLGMKLPIGPNNDQCINIKKAFLLVRRKIKPYLSGPSIGYFDYQPSVRRLYKNITYSEAAVKLWQAGTKWKESIYGACFDPG